MGVWTVELLGVGSQHITQFMQTLTRVCWRRFAWDRDRARTGGRSKATNLYMIIDTDTDTDSIKHESVLTLA